MPGITPNVKNREHHDGVRFGEEVEGVWEAAKEGSTDLTSDPRKSPRGLRGSPQDGIHLVLQFQSETGFTGFVPRNRFAEFKPCERPEEDTGTHSRGV